MRATALLRARALEKVYADGTVALRGIDLDVELGETVVIVGESGCGKSTLLKMWNRLLEPTAGELWFREEELTKCDPIELRRHIGYVQQEGGLLPHWTARRNVELVPQLLRWSRERRRERSKALLELVGLEPATYADRYPKQLSGGQRQRVAFARALAADPDVVLLDEPFGALDAITRVELQQEFLELKSRLGKTLLLITHDLSEACKLADRIAVMKAGEIVQIGTPESLRARPDDEYVTTLLAHGDAS